MTVLGAECWVLGSDATDPVVSGQAPSANNQAPGLTRLDLLLEDLRRRVEDYYQEEVEPGEGPARCLFCGRLTVPPLVEGWVVVCSACLGEEDQDG